MASTISAGTTAGTAIAIAGDTTGNLAFQTNGTTTAMTITTAQNIGVGTTSPNYPLQLVNSTANKEILFIQGANTNTSTGLGGEGPLALQNTNTTVNNMAAISNFDGNGNINSQINFVNVDHSGSSAIAFTTRTGGSYGERMRITSAGDVFIGATSSIGANERLGVYRSDNGTSAVFVSTNTGQSGDIIQVRANRNTTNGSFRPINYYNDAAGAYRFYVLDSGNCLNTNGSYGTISDIKLKENIVDATPKLDKVNQLKVRNFNLIDNDLKQIGFIAQEFAEVFPSMVEESQDRTPDGEMLETTTKTIKTTVLIPILVKALQELNAKVDAQAAEIAALKGAQ